MPSRCAALEDPVDSVYSLNKAIVDWCTPVIDAADSNLFPSKGSHTEVFVNSDKVFCSPGLSAQLLSSHWAQCFSLFCRYFCLWGPLISTSFPHSCFFVCRTLPLYFCLSFDLVWKAEGETERELQRLWCHWSHQDWQWEANNEASIFIFLRHWPDFLLPSSPGAYLSYYVRIRRV